MVPGVDIHSPRTRIVLLAVVLILAPGIVLGSLGFRSIASRAESLRTNYVATVVLVRDRLASEVDRLESDVVGAATAFVATPRTTADMATWLQGRSTEGAAYREYFGTDRLMFQVPELDDRLKNKAEILAIRLPDPSPGTPPLAIASAFLDDHPLHELEYGGSRLVVVTTPDGANRVFESADVDFDRLLDDGTIIDTSGRRWHVSEDALVAEFDDGLRLSRVPAHRAFWFGWYAQFPDTRLIK